MKKLFFLPILIVTVMFFIISCEKSTDPVSLSEGESESFSAMSNTTTPPPPSYPCAATPGYWKNHPDAWPVNGLTIGNIWYGKDDLIQLIGMPEKGDKTYTLFRAVVAARLNVLRGSQDCIKFTWLAANNWLKTNPPGSKVKGNSPEWKIGEPLYLELDDYNNGLLCVPGCD